MLAWEVCCMWFHRRTKYRINLSEYLPKLKAYISQSIEKEKLRKEREAKAIEERKLAEEKKIIEAEGAKKAAEKTRKETANNQEKQILSDNSKIRYSVAQDYTSNDDLKYSMSRKINVENDYTPLIWRIENQNIGIDHQKAKELVGFRTQAIRAHHTFSTEVIDALDRLNKKPSEFYKSVGMEKNIFSRIKNDPDYQPSRETAVKCCLGLHLNPDNADKLMKLAGFSFSPSSTWDLTIKFCLENRIYNIIDINLLLDALHERLFT